VPVEEMPGMEQMKLVKIDPGANNSEPATAEPIDSQLSRLEVQMSTLSSQLVETNRKLDFMRDLIVNAVRFVFIALPILVLIGWLLSLWVEALH
jgi:hypothetical protein